jgi:4-amino-4-deoxy-L-arabinose transferase-like glycosyltransferase
VTAWRWALVGIVLRAGFVVVAFATGSGERLGASDPEAYLSFATTLVSTGGFTHNGGPELFRTPGYPALLVPAVLSGHAHLTLIALQIATAGLTIALIHQLAREVTGEVAAAHVAAALACIDPVLVLWSLVPVTETTFTALATAALIQIRRTRARPSIQGAAAAAALVGIGTYVRPMAYGLGVLTPLALAWGPGGLRLPIRRRAAIVALVTFVAIVTPWHVRNWHVAGYPGFSTLLDRALYLSAGAAVVAHEQGVSVSAVRESRREAARDTWAATTDVRADYARFRAQGLSELARSPLVYTRMHIAGIARVLLDPGAVEYLRVLGQYPETGGLLGVAHDRGLATALGKLADEYPRVFALTLATGAGVAATLVSAAWGFVRLWRTDGRASDAVLLAAWAAYFVVLSGGAHGISRFRHPVVPVLCVFAGALAIRRRGPVPARTVPTSLVSPADPVLM